MQTLAGTKRHWRNLPHFQSPNCWYHVVISLRREVRLEPEECQVVFDALRFYDGTRWSVAAIAVLQRHGTHVLARPCPVPDRMGEVFRLDRIIQSVKGFSGKRINEYREAHGATIWGPEYYERTIRGKADFGHVVRYIRNNPRKHGFIDDAADWPWVYVAPEFRPCLHAARAVRSLAQEPAAAR